MLNFLRFSLILTALALGFSCSDDDPATPPRPTPPDPETEVVEIAMTRLAASQWTPGEGFDLYRIALATDTPAIDPDTGAMTTRGDGHLLVLALEDTPATDPAHPALSEGDYTLSDKDTAGSWQKSSALLTSKTDDNTEEIRPESGKVSVKKTPDGYTLSVTFLFSGKEFRITYTGALPFEGQAPEPEPEPEPEPQGTAITLTTVFQTQYAKGDAFDEYWLAMASGPVIFDEENATYRTEEDGYTMFFHIAATPAADPAHPVIPDASYPANAQSIPAWDISPDSGMGIVFHYTKADGLKTEQISEGQLVSTFQGDKYTFKADFKTNQGTYTATYSGAIEIQGDDPSAGQLTDPVDTTFIGGQACYLGADPDFPDLGVVRLEFYDAQPDELGTILGNLVKSTVYIALPTDKFTAMPAGTYEIGFGAAPFTAQPGYDDHVNIPTGTYIAQTTADAMKLAMIDSGTITIDAQGHATLDLSTTDWVSVCGTLNVPLEIFDKSEQGGGGQPEDPDGPYSSLKSDVEISLNDVPAGYLYEYGNQYENNTRNVVIQVLSAQTMTGFLLDLALPASDKGTPLAEGTYTLDDGTHRPFTFAPGTIMQPNAIGTWPFVSLYRDGEHTMVDFTNSGNAAGGTLSIAHKDGVYTITFDMKDDAPTPHRITGSWTGRLQETSYQSIRIR